MYISTTKNRMSELTMPGVWRSSHWVGCMSEAAVCLCPNCKGCPCMARPCPCKCNIYAYINIYLLLGLEQIGEEQNILLHLLERISPPLPLNTAGHSQQMISLPQILSTFVWPSLPGKLYIKAHLEGDIC